MYYDCLHIYWITFGVIKWTCRGQFCVNYLKYVFWKGDIVCFVFAVCLFETGPHSSLTFAWNVLSNPRRPQTSPSCRPLPNAGNTYLSASRNTGIHHRTWHCCFLMCFLHMWESCKYMSLFLYLGTLSPSVLVSFVLLWYNTLAIRNLGEKKVSLAYTSRSLKENQGRNSSGNLKQKPWRNVTCWLSQRLGLN